MIYKYNIIYVGPRSLNTFELIKSNLKAIRTDSEQNIWQSSNYISISEVGSNYLEKFIPCSKLKTFYALAAIRTDDNCLNQWFILKTPKIGYKNIIFSREKSLDLDLYRRMTLEEIKKYFNDTKYDA